MSIWVLHLDTVTEYEEEPLAAECYYMSSLYYPELTTRCWWTNNGYQWVMAEIEEIPLNHRVMALLLT